MFRSTWIPALTFALALSACGGKDITAPATPPPPQPPGPSYAAVSGTVSASPIWEVGYSWALDASAPIGSFSLAAGGSTSAQFELGATRGQSSSRTGASGQVCVNNTGAAATQGLSVAARVQRQEGEGWVDVAGATQSLPVTSQISAGQSRCFPYEILFDRDESATYRSVAQLSITNAEPQGSQGSSAPSASNIVFPSEPQASASGASLEASVDCADGFTCSADQSSWALEQTSSVDYVLNVQNSGAECGIVAEFAATFTLAVAGSDPMQVQRILEIATASCATGCTRLTGYWKDNSGLNGASDYVSDKLPILLGDAGGPATLEVSTAAQARDVFDQFGNSSNGVNRVYRHLLVAKLNIASGASDADIASVVAAADGFLASYGSSSWGGLSSAQRDQLTAWQVALEQYNSGVTGPGACS